MKIFAPKLTVRVIVENQDATPARVASNADVCSVGVTMSEELKLRVLSARAAVGRKYNGYPVELTHIIVGYETEGDMRAGGMFDLRPSLRVGEPETYLGLIVAIDRSLPRGEFRLAAFLAAC